ncbi:uncharacterized protein LOC122989328 isoform X2 [Thunnus albacares]|uniref:uncharacterized protein LOC122989328 isoform X2 n=1 Tax=Thunnus albacares TaxID=8236 RepID=UPI001CF67F26|nr:uncharacterized protein LOC122989328 isoform X2 [Thunnus albacares]
MELADIQSHHQTETLLPLLLLLLLLLPEMSLSCLRATDPNITNVIKLYDDESHSGHLWFGNSALPDCSSTSPPSPSSCVVCLQQVIYTVCSDLLPTVKLVMEAPGQQINIIKSECPGLLGDATVQNGDSSGSSQDTWEWWLILIPILLLIIVALVVYGLWKKYRKTSERLTRAEEEEAIHLRRLEMDRDAEAAV